MPILDHLTELSDLTRGRILLALEGRELAVAELQSVLQLPQSTVSRHLGVLSRGGWVTARPDGASHRYRLTPDELSGASRRLWDLVREEVGEDPAVRTDRERLQAVLAERHRRSQAFFASEAGRWDLLREELFGRRFDLQVLLSLLDPDWVVGDLGCGSGHLAATLAPFVRNVVAVDESEAMIDAARSRTEHLPNVEIRQGELELLPVAEAELDLAIVALVLPYLPDPGRILAEAARALQPGGRLLVIDLQPHDRAEYEHTMGHLWLGFEPETLHQWFTAAGLAAARVTALPPDPQASGPGLFTASARKPDLHRTSGSID